MLPVSVRLPAALLVLLAPVLAACTENKAASSGADRTITVDSSDDACDLSATEVPSGSLTFQVTNSGSEVTEFYLYGEDGERIVGEVENIGPGLSRDLTVAAPAGSYVAACKPGMAGDGIRVDLTVTDSGRPSGRSPTRRSWSRRSRATRPTSSRRPTRWWRRPRSS